MTDKKSDDTPLHKAPHAIATFIKPFILGARVQLRRYLEANEAANKHHLMEAHYECLYEASSLFEHLATVATYLGNADINLKLNATIKDFRNHIRHDARGEIDDRSGKRAKRLGLQDGLEVGIEFPLGGIKIGTTELTANQLGLYLDMAETSAYGLLLSVPIEVAD
jgi:hypothetical protein